VLINVEAARVDNTILHKYLTSTVVLEAREIGNADSNIPTDLTHTDDQLNVGMPGGSRDFKDEGDESNAVPTASR
jgi:hypothetical protein